MEHTSLMGWFGGLSKNRLWENQQLTGLFPTESLINKITIRPSLASAFLKMTCKMASSLRRKSQPGLQLEIASLVAAAVHS